MEITAEMVRKLREETGAGMMECKNALVEAKGDPETARDVLRKKGLASAAKKAGRAANDGMVGTYIHPGSKVGVLHDGPRMLREVLAARRRISRLPRGGRAS